MATTQLRTDPSPTATDSQRRLTFNLSATPLESDDQATLPPITQPCKHRDESAFRRDDAAAADSGRLGQSQSSHASRPNGRVRIFCGGTDIG